MAVRDAGSIIRELRLATGMSQWDFCDGICSVQTLSNIENGKQAISPIVFQSLTEKCGEMINPYPQFVSLDDFQCYSNNLFHNQHLLKNNIVYGYIKLYGYQ